MQSLISFPSEVVVEHADITQNVPWVTANLHFPIFVWYEWTDWAVSFQQNRRAYMWTARAYYSSQPDLDERANVSKAAHIRIATHVALQDNADTWRWKGVETANETLDNLVQLFAMQNGKEYEIEKRLTFIPRD
jgi:hypothetical protein